LYAIADADSAVVGGKRQLKGRRVSRRGSPVLGCVGGSEIKTRRRFGWADGGGFGDEEEANAATVQSAIKMASACVCVCVCTVQSKSANSAFSKAATLPHRR